MTYPYDKYIKSHSNYKCTAIFSTFDETLNMKKLELKGRTFGRLTVIKEDGRTDKGRVIWKCLCNCGNIKRVISSEIKNGHVKSCGCLFKDSVKKASKTHGLSKHPLYVVWQGIKRRCTNVKEKAYLHYGGRGISICQSWLKFETFYKDMQPSWKPGLTIERIDVNGNYCKENCRWATRFEQSRNHRYHNKINIDNNRILSSDVARLTGLSQSTILKRQKRGWNGDSMLLPSMKKKYEVVDLSTEKVFDSIRSAAKCFGIDNSSLSKMLKGKLKNTTTLKLRNNV